MKVRGRHYLTGEMCEVALQDGVITAISTVDDATCDAWLAPGLIDIQVNGYRGYNFCSAAVTVDEVTRAVEALSDAGVTAFCPTVTTGAPAATEASVRTIARARAANAIVGQRVLAIHLEGPHISPIDGPRGAHPRQHVRPADWDEFCRLQAAAGGLIGLVTLAPEQPGALDFIARASQAGVVVSLGHHNANREQIGAAVHAGATLCTHLGNGAHSELPRHNNYIWEQLAHDGLQASIIVDGHHLPPAVVKCFLRAKGASRLILVSDVMAAAGLPPGTYDFMGMDVDLRADGSVRLTGTPYLAGSSLKLCDAIPNIMDFAGASFADAISMATANPARLMGAAPAHGALRVGARADVTVWRASNGRYTLAQTIARGEVCFEA